MKVHVLVLSSMLLFTSLSFAGNGHKPGPGKESAPVSEQILQSFKTTFPNARQIKWVELTDHYTVNFNESSVSAKITYDKQGNFVSAFRYYQEGNLPVSILCKLQKQYAGQKVFGVTEVTTVTEVEYYIKLETDKTWMTVRSTVSGNMETLDEFNKIP